MDPLSWFFFGLVALGVAGSVLPLVPGGFLSVVGVVGYWWSTGFAEPSPLLVVVLVGVGLLTMLVDYFGGAIAARAGGASIITMGAAVLVGFLLLVVAGPVGFIVGIAGTVFAVEFAQHADTERGLRVALYATVGVLASTAVQVVLTASVFLVLAFVVFI
ncbi:DUF456 domain-containing protein [Halobellus captivus]|uniref:DUF456 domain-containing protein n=1 Tax=Halobellus captivus TaxID=2592614 RepID=UPI00119F5AD3|nr:DUF456 domain-containing protein [Halobellus captivus]